MTKEKQINVMELQKEFNKGSIAIIDVREPNELKICKIADSISVPLNRIPYKLDMFEESIKYAIICHSGYRSQIATDYLNQRGFNCYNVRGGIDSWAENIDNAMKRY
tara:strand:+ start:1261 stop:1581 length:321 start_codon:yes stop_codon:yes gene_type:complete